MTHTDSSHPGSDNPLLLAIGAVVMLYVLATSLGWTAPPSAHEEQGSHAAADPEHDHEAGAAEHPPHPEPKGHPEDPATDQTQAHGSDTSHGGHGTMPDYYAVIPFVLLLGAIALLPLIR